MTTLSESRILGALAKATGIGLVEERFTVGGCEVVMRNLRPDEYEAIVQETKDLKDSAYLYAFQIGHVSRSIIEIGGVDLRDIDFVETEIPDPTPTDPERMKKVMLEKYDWLNRKVLSGWAREALGTCYRKFADVLTRADEYASSGITFVVPDETDEDKFKRLLVEALASAENLPPELVDRMFDHVGYVKKSTSEERMVAEEKLSRLKAETEAKEEPPALPVEAPQAASEVSPQPTPQELMQRRQPLNQAVPQAPSPPVRLPPVRQPAPLVPEATPQLRGRAAELAAIEAGALVDVPQTPVGFPPRPSPDEIPMLSREQSGADPRGVASILDQPPMVGVNPRFRPPPR